VKCHFVYRSTGKENRKKRPAYYSKAVALASFLAAVDALPVSGDIVFVNDAPIPAALEDVMRQHGLVINVPGLTMLTSYQRALAVPEERGWAADDLVYFSEDDYLYQPDAFVSLVDVACQAPAEAYFALYASYAGLEPSGQPVPADRRRRERSGASYVGAGRPWVTALSTTSSFGARVQTLRKDRLLHRYAPRTGGPWDHAISLAHSGRLAFDWRDLSAPLISPDYRLAHAARQFTLRLGLDALSIASKYHPRPLIAAVPALATHMEEPHVAAGTDWSAVAAATRIPAAPIQRSPRAGVEEVRPGSVRSPRWGVLATAATAIAAAAFWLTVHHHHHLSASRHAGVAHATAGTTTTHPLRVR
jgi:hypothetical protein